MKTSLMALGLACLTAASCSQRLKPGSGSNNTTGNLTGKHWVLRELPDTTLPSLKKEIFISFQSGSDQMNGFGGCNGMSGRYTVKNDQLKIGQVISTQMWCEYGPFEQKVFRMLANTNRYQLSGRQLSLYKDQQLLGRFEATDPQ